MTYGVPQGSILGPLLFNIFINDLPLHLKYCSIEMYADDTTLYTVGKNIVDLKYDLNANAQNMTNWFHNNRLMLNVSKSHYMLICSHQKRIHLSEIDQNIMMLNNEIQTVDSMKLLGVYVDHNLSWQNHINSIQKRLVSLIGLLYIIGPFLDKASMLLFYNAYVLPVLDYCISIWGHSAEYTCINYRFCKTELHELYSMLIGIPVQKLC